MRSGDDRSEDRWVQCSHSGGKLISKLERLVISGQGFSWAGRNQVQGRRPQGPRCLAARQEAAAARKEPAWGTKSKRAPATIHERAQGAGRDQQPGSRAARLCVIVLLLGLVGGCQRLLLCFPELGQVRLERLGGRAGGGSAGGGEPGWAAAEAGVAI